MMQLLVAVTAVLLSVPWLLREMPAMYWVSEDLVFLSESAERETDADVNPTPTIVFVGDILLARDVEALQRRYGWQHPFERIAFPSESYVVGNFESSIPVKHTMTPHLITRFSSPTTSAQVLKDAGITHVSLANNHTFDFGVDALEYTSSILADVGVHSFGHPHNHATHTTTLVSSGDVRIALIGLNAVFQDIEVRALDALLTTAAAASDLQIVYIHWGPEYILQAHEAQRELARNLVAAGADLIIGHHPHVVQDIELIDGVLVFYSLGNFIFDQYFSLPVQQGMIVEVDIHTATVTLTPVTSQDSRTQPRHMNDQERQQFLADLALRSDVRLQAEITEGVLPLQPIVASSTKMAMIIE